MREAHVRALRVLGWAAASHQGGNRAQGDPAAHSAAPLPCSRDSEPASPTESTGAKQTNSSLCLKVTKMQSHIENIP